MKLMKVSKVFKCILNEAVDRLVDVGNSYWFRKL